jgi:acyl dehydratase
MTEKEIVEFGQKYDPQYYHVDPEAARNSPFGGLVCPGCQTIALAWKLAYQTGLFDDLVLAGIGLDRIRWLAPVRAGDVVHVEFFLVESRQSESQPDREVVKFQYEMKNQRGEVVLTLQMLQILRRRPSERAS